MGKWVRRIVLVKVNRQHLDIILWGGVRFSTVGSGGRGSRPMTTSNAVRRIHDLEDV